MTTRTDLGMQDAPSTRSMGLESKPRWYQAWMRFAHVLGNIWAWILLSLFFVVVITPIGLIYQRFNDPLRIKTRKPGWVPLSNQFDRREDATLQS